MSRSLDISRPDLVFALIWGGALALNITLPVAFSVDPDPRVIWLIVANIVSFLVIYAVVSRGRRRRPAVDVASLVRGSWEEQALARFMVRTFLVWAALYVVTIIASGGLPVLWWLTGAGRTYHDFGVPTLTGLLNMIRAFLFGACILLNIRTGRSRYSWWAAALLLSTVLEFSRGALMVLVLHGVGMYLMFRHVTLRSTIRLAVLGASLVILFGVLGDLRGGGIQSEALVADQEWFLMLPVGVFFVFVYIVSPINNLHFAADSIDVGFIPFQTIAPLLPTVVRSLVFPATGEYAIELKTEAFNATTFYSPLLADFGWVGAFLVVCALQYVCARVHVHAAGGSLKHVLIFPVLFMCVVLSVFYMYFFALVTVLFPALVWFCMNSRGLRLMRLKRSQRIGPSSDAATSRGIE